METNKKDAFDKLIEAIIFYVNIEVIDNIDLWYIDATKWLNAISASASKWCFYQKEQHRALKNLNKIVKNARIESGHILGSMFLNISVVRENITTVVIDGKEMKDFFQNPYDFDYEISADNIKKELQTPKPTSEIFSVTTCDGTQPTACPHCEGKGSLRCKKCGGLRNEQYVDDNFENGEKRIRNRQCVNCYGTGKIQCDNCAGSGKLPVFAKPYQIIKRFENTKNIMSYTATSSTFEPYVDDYCSTFYRISTIDNEEFDRWKPEDEIKYYWSIFDNQELKADIKRLHKNQKEITIDKTAMLQDKIWNKYESRLYEINRQAALDCFYENKQGKLGCFIEKHFAKPLFRIYFSTILDDSKCFIDIYKNSDNNVVVCLGNLPELSFFKSLFLKIKTIWMKNSR
jgi:hypothetical protein